MTEVNCTRLEKFGAEVDFNLSSEIADKDKQAIIDAFDAYSFLLFRG